jgi:hypothetical protein
MNALRKPIEIDRPESRISTREDSVLLPLIASQTLFLGEVASRFDPPRRPHWEEESPPARSSRLYRLLGALSRRLWPQWRPDYLSEHLCRDIGLDWIPPEPPPRSWPW